ncbi:MAG: phosphate-starvation-inducible PsiE family protein [Xenococcaceae cyanobacterium MO_167.B52]|nr:phosphate-starvation-inducible PsiE family protein [Xenococcaceae cyanobacterium MO_167.B52]
MTYLSGRMENPLKKIKEFNRNENFLKLVYFIENGVAKVLSLALLAIILIALGDLVFFISHDVLSQEPVGLFNKTIIELFGLFLNILIALELLENITAYLKKQVVQVELVLITALIAVARKIIIFDIDKKSSSDLMALGVAILCLSVGYAVVRLNRQKKN